MLKAYIIHVLAHYSRIKSKMTDSCIFCKIVSSEIPANIDYRDEQVTAFRDINPVAPTHILIVPNRHIESVGTLKAEDEPLVGHLFTVVSQLANEEGISRGLSQPLPSPAAGQVITVLKCCTRPRREKHIRVSCVKIQRYPSWPCRMRSNPC